MVDGPLKRRLHPGWWKLKRMRVEGQMTLDWRSRNGRWTATSWRQLGPVRHHPSTKRLEMLHRWLPQVSEWGNGWPPAVRMEWSDSMFLPADVAKPSCCSCRCCCCPTAEDSVGARRTASATEARPDCSVVLDGTWCCCPPAPGSWIAPAGGKRHPTPKQLERCAGSRYPADGAWRPATGGNRPVRLVPVGGVRWGKRWCWDSMTTVRPCADRWIQHSPVAMWSGAQQVSSMHATWKPAAPTVPSVAPQCADYSRPRPGSAPEGYRWKRLRWNSWPAIVPQRQFWFAVDWPL